ncbi:MAG: MmcQ/YjbR family DNA-binding protein [Herpetosiphonaceae bacterium]|nr:MmcQ/YjbR family DNA-binding protein [Herpetosiphonaceae bacterium]
MSNLSPEPFGFTEARAHCEQLEGSGEEFPFGPDVMVFKVNKKIFALLNFAQPAQISLKCDPDRAELLREQYPAITAGYHLNKRHWITLTLDGSVPAAECRALIDHSYALVAPKRRRRQPNH